MTYLRQIYIPMYDGCNSFYDVLSIYVHPIHQKDKDWAIEKKKLKNNISVL